VGIKKAMALAEKKQERIDVALADFDDHPIKKNAFDLILCFNFLDRRLFPVIAGALKPGGLLYFETFSIDYLKYSSFKREWVLEHNELLRVFSHFRILNYREIDREEKACASLVARKWGFQSD